MRVVEGCCPEIALASCLLVGLWATIASMNRAEAMGSDQRSWAFGGAMLVSLFRRVFAVAVVVGVFLSASSVSLARPHYRLSVLNKQWIKKTYADSLGISVDRVKSYHVYDLKSVRGVVGFVLGRTASRDGKWVYGSVTFYSRMGDRYMMAGVRLNAADKIRVFQVVDLSARETRFSPAMGAWFLVGHRVKEPQRRARRPLLVVETKTCRQSRCWREMIFISLKDPKHPKKLLTFTTRSVSTPPKATAWKKGMVRRPRYPRFSGNRVVSVRLQKKRGAKPTLEISRAMISTRFDRGRRPQPRIECYTLKSGRFVSDFSFKRGRGRP